MIVLDTNVISELSRDRPNPRVIRWLDSIDAADLWITAVNAAELWRGLELRPPGQKTDRLRAEVQGIVEDDLDGRVLPLDLAGAMAYAKISAALKAIGRPVDSTDALIAGICASYGAQLATRNTTHFRDTGVELIDPWTVEPLG